MSLTGVREWRFVRTVYCYPFLCMLLCERVRCMGPDFTASTEPAGHAVDTCWSRCVHLLPGPVSVEFACCQQLLRVSWCFSVTVPQFHLLINFCLFHFSVFTSILSGRKWVLNVVAVDWGIGCSAETGYVRETLVALDWGIGCSAELYYVREIFVAADWGIGCSAEIDWVCIGASSCCGWGSWCC